MSFKSFIITFKDHVPESDMLTIKSSIASLGGDIVHEYSLIKGFSVKLPETLSIEEIKDIHGGSIANIEEDKEVKVL